MTEHLTPRIGQQREDVLAVMRDGKWRTFEEIQTAVLNHSGFARYHSEASISARLRDFRKVKYGGYTVNMRPRRGRLNEYQVVLPAPGKPVQIGMFEARA